MPISLGPEPLTPSLLLKSLVQLLLFENEIEISAYNDTAANVNVLNGNNFGTANKTITVDETGTLTVANAKDIKGNLDNNGTLYLTEGTVLSTITGTGETTFIENIQNDSSITQETVIISSGKTFFNNGTLTTTQNADGKGFQNNGNIVNTNSIIVAGGQSSGNITGNGDFTNSGNFVNNDYINQKTITNSGTLNTNSQTLIATNGITNNGTLTYDAGTMTVSDIKGNNTAASKVEIKTGSDFTINNTIASTNIDLYNSILNFGNNANISSATMNVYGGGINVTDGQITTTNLDTININGNSNLAIDFDLNNLTSDNFNATVNNNGGKFNVNNINLLGTTTNDNIKVHLGDTTNLGQENVTSETIELPTIMTPVRKIKGRVEDGWIVYSGSSSTSVEDFNPSILASPVATQAGVQATLNNTFNYAFNNADIFTKLPKSERSAMINANRYALNTTSQVNGASSTDFNENMNVGNVYQDNSGVWFRPYTTFESIPLENGPKVDATAYGTLVGVDSDFHHHKNGWDSVTSAYIGYNGAQLDYKGVDTSMNGGQLGVTQTFYKNNFWTAITATTGASVAETHSMYGHEDSTSLMAGIGSKTGYNIEFKEGKFIVQPMLFMSYSMVNNFDYKNAAGVKIDSKPLNTIQLNPSVRFIGNVKGWQPYASVGMVWNLMNKSDVTANGIKLPETHVKPYVQYGVGVQKQIGEKFTGFAQAMISNGGRNGISLTCGFRWTLGSNDKKDKNNEKVQVNNGQVNVKNTQQPTKKVVKQLNSTNTAKENNLKRYYELINQPENKISKSIY